MKKIIKEKWQYIILILVSFILVLFNTSLSPLRDPGYITQDASVFYVIGRGIKAGLIPYKDLFDHKGIYIYFLYFIASLIDEEFMIGVYLVYSILVSVFSIYVYKITSIYTEKKYISLFTSMTLTMLSITMYFSHGALHAEYLALATIIISMYLLVRYIEKENIEASGFPAKYMFINGILAGINIFNKFNYTLYFLAVAIYAFIEIAFVKKNIKLLLFNILYGFIGLIIGMAPCLIYCISTNSLSDMFFGTFIFNFEYANELSVDLPNYIKTKPEALLYTLKVYIWSYLVIIVSLFILFVKKIKIRKVYIISLILLSISIFTPMNGYTHYQEIILPFFIPFIIAIYTLIDKYIIREQNFVSIRKVFSSIICIIVISIISYIYGYKEIEKTFSSNSAASLEINKIIREKIRVYKNVKMLNYGIGVYYYNYFYVIPGEKYFYIPSIAYDKFKEPYDTQYEAIKNFKYDVIIYSVVDAMEKSKTKEAQDFLYANYKPIYELDKGQRTLFVKKELIK